MDRHVEYAMELRNGICPNCAETIYLTYAKELGLGEEVARSLGTNFGGGMKSGMTCGAITSGVAVLGALGITDPRSVGLFIRTMKENHGGLTDCMDLLRRNAQMGGQKKPHCDRMIADSIALIEQIRAAAGK